MRGWKGSPLVLFSCYFKSSFKPSAKWNCVRDYKRSFFAKAGLPADPKGLFVIHRAESGAGRKEWIWGGGTDKSLPPFATPINTSGLHSECDCSPHRFFFAFFIFRGMGGLFCMTPKAENP